MNNSSLSLAQRILRMICIWLFLGAGIAVLDGLESGGGIRFSGMRNGGLVALAIPGAVIGLMGGDAAGSFAGAAAALVGSWAARHFGQVPIEPDLRNEIVILGAFVGAMAFAFLRMMCSESWLLLRAIGHAVGSAPVGDQAPKSSGHQ
jgi:hypothetical protein